VGKITEVLMLKVLCPDSPMSTKDKSVEKASDLLPCFAPVLTTMILVPRSPEPVRHRTEVSDSQCVASHAVKIRP
jgi:hypothetical protein